ncbi:MAG: hypothetical protein BV458_12845, partial [Thermoplasmata archaeon M9B2D]
IQALLAQRGRKEKLDTLQMLILKEELAWRLGKLDEGHDTIKKVEKLLSSGLGKNDEESELERRKASHYSQAGVIYWYKGELDKALEYHQMSLKIREKLGDKSGILRALNNLGLVYDVAADFYQRSLRICEETNDQDGLSRVLNNLANISSALGNLDEALQYHERSLSLKEKIAGKQDVALSLINIGVIFRLKGDLDRAEEYYNRSLKIQKHLSIGPEFALVLNNLGEIYTLKGELDEALELYQRSLLIYEDMGNREGIALTLMNIGDMYGRKGDPEIAFNYYRRSLSTAEEISNARLTSSALSELIWLSLDYEDNSLAEKYFSQLESMRDESHGALINQQYRVSEALLLKKKGRSKDRLRAEEILEQVVGEEIVDHTLTVKAMIHLCDLLITEFKATGDEEMLRRINDLTEQLLTIAQQQSSHSLVVESYLLRSKLAIIDFEIGQAHKLLNKAKSLADEKGLQRLSVVVNNEMKKLDKQQQKWESIINKNPSKEEMVSLTELNNLVERMVQKTVLSLGIESASELAKKKYLIVHQDLLEATEKSEKSAFRVGIAQIGLSENGDILGEQYEERIDGLLGLQPECVESSRAKVRQMVEKAHALGVNVLIFPEMTIDLTYDEFTKDLRTMAREYEMYIVPGSFHDSGSRHNLCTIFGPDGILWTQKKHNPAIIHIKGNRFMERIETESESKKVIISKTEYGRIAIVICRDFLDMDLRVALKNSDPPVDLVINPAFTPVTADFRAAHFDARRSIYAYCFFANVAEFGDSLIYTPEKERIERTIQPREENLIFKDVDLFQLRTERKRWEEQQRKQTSFIQSTR